MGKSPLYTTEQFIKAIPGTGGIISTIAKKVGCHRHTAKIYIEKYPTIKQAYENERSSIDDAAEIIILNAILKDGDLATAKWWLSKKRPAEFGDKIGVVASTEDGKPFPLRITEVIIEKQIDEQGNRAV